MADLSSSAQIEFDPQQNRAAFTRTYHVIAKQAPTRRCCRPTCQAVPEFGAVQQSQHECDYEQDVETDA